MRTWKTLSSEEIYRNPHTKVVVDKVISPGGEETEYCHVEKMNGVVVIPYDGKDIYFVRQYRYPAKSNFLELPMGGSDGEEPKIAAMRELAEETNITAKSLEVIGDYVLSPGFSACRMDVVLATQLETSKVGLKNQEHVEAIHEIKKYSIKEIKSLIKDGKIRDGHTLSALNIFFNSQH